MDDPIVDLRSDDYFMGEALHQAVKAFEKEEVPVGAVIVREGKIIARAFNQVELGPGVAFRDRRTFFDARCLMA